MRHLCSKTPDQFWQLLAIQALFFNLYLNFSSKSCLYKMFHIWLHSESDYLVPGLLSVFVSNRVFVLWKTVMESHKLT